jgi:hypothetical protein
MQEENNKDNNIKSVIDIINNYGINSVSTKTNISIESLKKFLEGNYIGFTKIKTIGFVTILEREYDIDLTDLKNDIKDEFNVNKSLSEYQTLLCEPIEDSSSNNSSSKLLYWIVIFGLIYGAWYIYENYYEKSFHHFSEVEPFFNIEKNISNIQVNKDISSAILKKSILDTTTKKKSVLPIVVEKNITSTDDIAEDEKDIELNSSISEVVDNNISDINLTKTTPPLVVENVRESIELIPHKKMWFGFINTTKKWHRSYKRTQSYTFDVKDSNWLLMTKNASFDLNDNNITTSYEVKNVIYFKIDKDGVAEVTKDEYKALGGYRVW